MLRAAIQIRPGEGEQIVVVLPYSPEQVETTQQYRHVSQKELRRIRGPLDTLGLSGGADKKGGDEQQR